MTDLATRLETLQDLFLNTHRLYSWCIESNYELLFTNCPGRSFFFQIFENSACSSMIYEHFKTQSLPLLVNDTIGLSWLAAARRQDGILHTIHVLGPLFTVEASEKYLKKLCSQKQFSQNLIDEFEIQLKDIPTITQNLSLQFLKMLHYTLTSEKISINDIILKCEAETQNRENEWGNSNYHGTWNIEQELFRKIMNGDSSTDFNISVDMTSGNIGNMCIDNPLRQAKNEGIVLVVLSSRAAIMGGVSPEGGYNLSDYYIQRIEACDNIPDVISCNNEIIPAFVKRVQQCKKDRKYSSPVAGCMDYVRTHIMEKINLENMAHEIGYTGYYITRKFQSETGKNLNTYIKEEKIELAKQYLRDSTLTIADISERLSFSSPSYFTSVFRKITGESPSDYLNKEGKKP